MIAVVPRQFWQPRSGIKTIYPNPYPGFSFDLRGDITECEQAISTSNTEFKRRYFRYTCDDGLTRCRKPTRQVLWSRCHIPSRLCSHRLRESIDACLSE